MHKDKMPDKDANRYEFYANQYARFGSRLAAEVRLEAYGKDLGQQGWRSLGEQQKIEALFRARPGVQVLDIACGSGGPSLALVAETDCQLIGIDIEPAGVEQATNQAALLGLQERVNFLVADCNARLAFEDASFGFVVCIDAINHMRDRLQSMADWCRILRPGGALIFTDAAVLTGAISKREMDIRASQGEFVLVPPGVDEKTISTLGLHLVESLNTTAEVAAIASKLHAARHTRSLELMEEEGKEWFEKRQNFLLITARLAAEGRLSRFLYVAEKR
jgi:ubiquinone/menaquinone biosynthesis C-methylase UbiE